MNTALPEVGIPCTAAALLQRTPDLVLGPFYPVRRICSGGDLWAQRTGLDRRAQPVELSGCVVDLRGCAVVDALVEVWQADEGGRYDHPSARKPAAHDAGFGYGALRTDSSGRYLLRTLKPGAYGEEGRRRAPHIHFQVTGAHDRLVTQMFFPDEPLNAQDHWLRATTRAHQLVASITNRSREVLHISWDIVLSTG